MNKRAYKPRLEMKVDAATLLRLIEAHESWAGALPPDERESYLAEFKELKAGAEAKIARYHKHYKVKLKDSHKEAER